ncbi:MAG: O-antigen/teichoic acid export membrane protein [Polaribacter sp.]|jgi:O-antigen/teichoic acid export membrane protein
MEALPLMTEPRSLLNDVISVFSSKMVVLVLTFIGSVILARALSAEGRGILAAALIYPQLLLAITEGGMRQAAIYFIGQKKAKEADILGALISYTIVASIIGAFIVYSLMLWFGSDYFDNAMMIVTALILPTSLAVNALKGVFLGHQNIQSFNRISWVQKLFYVGCIFILYLVDQLTIFSAILATALAALFNLIQAIIYLKKENQLTISFNKSTLFNMLKIGVVYAVAFFLITANYKIDIFLLGLLTTPEQIGNYVIAVQIGELAWQLPAAVIVVMFAKSANSKGDVLVQQICQASRLTITVTLFILLGLLFVSFFMIIPIFGEDYQLAYHMLLWLAPGLLLATIFKSTNSYFAGQGKPSYSIIIMGIAVSANIALNYVFIPSYGAKGAAMASSISYALSAIISLYFFTSKTKSKVVDVLIINKKDITLCIKILKNKLGRNVK